jgi:hypothetical protein
MLAVASVFGLAELFSAHKRWNKVCKVCHVLKAEATLRRAWGGAWFAFIDEGIFLILSTLI